ncbi:hypothetical protein CHUAL_008152 [Chamberlinius hualienensis]
MADDIEENEDQGKWSKMPCFRSTFLTSIPSGMAAGLGYFMFTSKARMAGHVGYGTFFVVTVAYWIRCRYNFSVAKFNYSQLQRKAREMNLLEGTAEIPVDDVKPT